MNLKEKKNSVLLMYEDENKNIINIQHEIGCAKVFDLTHLPPCINFRIDHTEDCLITLLLKGWKVENNGDFVSIEEINEVESFDVKFASTGTVPLVVKDGLLYKRLISNDHVPIGKGKLTYIPKKRVLKAEIKISNRNNC